MRIFAGFAREGASNKSGVVENGDYSLLSLAISSEPSHPRPQLLYCTLQLLSPTVFVFTIFVGLY